MKDHKILCLHIQVFVGDVNDETFNDDHDLCAAVADSLSDAGFRDQLLDISVVKGA